MIGWKSTGYWIGLLVIFGFLNGTNGKVGKPCTPDILYTCDANESCVIIGQDSVCQCIHGAYETPNGCILIPKTTIAPTQPPDLPDQPESSSGSSVAVGLLVPIFLIILSGLGFCLARRYRLLPCRRNRYGNVLVSRADDDDDDDPPIA